MLFMRATQCYLYALCLRLFIRAPFEVAPWKGDFEITKELRNKYPEHKQFIKTGNEQIQGV